MIKKPIFLLTFVVSKQRNNEDTTIHQRQWPAYGPERTARDGHPQRDARFFLCR